MNDMEALLDKELNLARAMDTLAAMINGGRVAPEDRAGVRDILEYIFAEYNAVRKLTRAMVLEQST